MTIQIRPATLDDAPRLPQIERAAGQSFRTLPDLAWIADGEPMSADRHRQLIEQGASWIAELDDKMVGFLAAERAGPELHIAELSVLPTHQRQGIGRRLIAEALRLADNQGLTAVTLTTFRDVPWNAPYYARIGFQEVPPLALSARLAAIRADESRHGLPAERRCAMRYPLSQA